MINFSAIIRNHSENQPDREAIAYQGKRFTYREFNNRIDLLAKSLNDIGLSRADRVALLLYNCPEFLEICLAANRAGLIFLPINYRLASEEVEYILRDSQAGAIFTEQEFVATIEAMKPRLPNLKCTITLEQPARSSWMTYDSLIAPGGRAIMRDTEVDLEDLHRLMYTSGTTADPKGVMITYNNLYWKNFGQISELGISKDDVGLVAGPLYHVGGLDLSAIHILHMGGRLVILRKFETKSVLEAIERERITLTWLAPTMVNMILNEPRSSGFRLDSVRVIINGGEKMPESLVQKLLNTFPNAWFADAYGLTETVSGDTFLDKQSTIRKLGSVGKPILGLDLKIVDDNGNEVQRGQEGEIALRGPKVFKGYWNNPKATEEAFRDGWFLTGDIGKLDEEGYLYIIDRKKDMIISGGENISSLHVERVLYAHPKVLEAAVIGVPDKNWGQVPLAYVVLKRNETAQPEDILNFCEGKLAKFAVPKHLRFVETLPRNPSGKVLKKELRKLSA